MNTFGEDVCTLVAEEVVVFPNPGDQVFYGSGFDASSAPVRAASLAPRAVEAG